MSDDQLRTAPGLNRNVSMAKTFGSHCQMGGQCLDSTF